jgi:hypothetical protein
MAFSKKPLSDIEKKAKLTALRDANKTATDIMSGNLKDSKGLKSHVKSMSEEAGIDFKNDSDELKDPTHNGNVVGRHISDENIDKQQNASTYNIDELDAEIKKLLEQKAKIFKGK